VVCPGRGTAWPATGRSGVERNCSAHERLARPGRPDRGGTGASKRCDTAWPSVGMHVYRAATGSVIRRISALMPENDCCLRNPGTAGQSGAAGMHDPVLEVAVRAAHLLVLSGSLSPPALLPPTTVSRLLYFGSGATASVIDAITRRAHPGAGLPVLILTIPNNPILHPVRLPDCNCGATQVRTGMCVHV
jgi:hypothetical protein